MTTTADLVTPVYLQARELDMLIKVLKIAKGKGLGEVEFRPSLLLSVRRKLETVLAERNLPQVYAAARRERWEPPVPEGLMCPTCREAGYAVSDEHDMCATAYEAMKRPASEPPDG